VTERAAFSPSLREAVASFPDRRHFHAAVERLLAEGFAPSDLSVLATHDPLATAGEPDGGRREWLPAALSGEVKYLVPLTVAGFSVVSGGPVAVALAALVGAGLGGAALKELFDDYTAPPRTAEFRTALAAGDALLWVRVDDPAREAAATRILTEAGGRNIHVNERAATAHAG
jgi:hypothetical protein